MGNQVLLIRDLLKSLEPLFINAQKRFEWGTALPDSVTQSRMQEKIIMKVEEERAEARKEVLTGLKSELTQGVSKGLGKGLLSTIGL